MIAGVKRPFLGVKKCSRGSVSWSMRLVTRRVSPTRKKVTMGEVATTRSRVMTRGGLMTRTTYFVYIVDAIIKSIIMNANRVQKIASA
jgi:hypothetical protein